MEEIPIIIKNIAKTFEEIFDRVVAADDYNLILRHLDYKGLMTQFKHILKFEENKQIDYVFIESAIILECGYTDICDEFWYVSAPLEERIRRLKAARGYTDEKIAAIMSNQKQDKEFEKQCDIVLVNDGNIEKIFSQLKILLV